MTSVQNHQQLLSGNKYILIILVVLCSLNSSFAQSKREFQKKYAQSKDFFNEGKYSEAYEGFRLLTQQNDNNEFEEFAHYYTGYAAFRVNKTLDAKFILVKAINQFPDWKQLYEVKYLLARIAFFEKDYNRAFELCSEIIFEKKIQEDVVKLIRKEVINGADLSLILSEQIKHPDNFTLAKAIADRIKYFGGSLAEKMLLQYLIQDYGFNPDQYSNVFLRKSVKKPVYNIAVLLPFEFKDKMNWSRSGKAFEMLEGINMAVEELEKAGGAKFKLFTYDTKKDSATVSALLNLPEMKQMDLMIGAYVGESSRLVKRFAESNQIHYVNPLNGDPQLVGVYSKLFKPSYTETGKQLATAVVDSFPNKPEVCVFYGSSPIDSLMAVSYKINLELKGKKVTTFKRITRTDTKELQTTIAKLKLDSLSHFAVFHREDLVATNFMSAIEGRIAGIEAKARLLAKENEVQYEGEPLYIPVVAPVEWLDVYIIQFEQFIRRGVHFYKDDYIDYKKTEAILFRKKIKERMGVLPSSDYSAVGFDCMYIFGGMLNKYGNSYVEELITDKFISGYNYLGVNYSSGESNSVVPLLKLDSEYHLNVLNQE